ncbi:MAG TPA: CPBP family intramembrane glutamic endopeptidase [Rhizomicrobium sp.]|nr:CPBP family intramembrane glutamic endopeptidase [Rhizomicrobium sp.]
MSSVSKLILAPIAAFVLSFAITAFGEGIWGVLAIANVRVHPEWPWSVVTMATLLTALLLYLGGFGPPAGTRELRRRLLRWNRMPWRVFGWAVLAGLLGDIALGGVWIVTSDIVHLPAGLTPSMKGIPMTTGIALLVMASLAAPLSEEAAFRGYAQGILERAWVWAPAAILGSSVLFAAAHFPQGLFLPKLSLYFFAGLIFGTVAYLTNSLYAAMVVHSLADFEGFLLLWPHDAKAHALVTEGGHDPLFIPAVAALIVALPLSVLAFRHLARITAAQRARALARPAAVDTLAGS